MVKVGQNWWKLFAHQNRQIFIVKLRFGQGQEAGHRIGGWLPLPQAITGASDIIGLQQ